MYLVISIVLISLTEVIVMIVFRFWEMKDGRVSENKCSASGMSSLFYYMHRAQHILNRYTRLFIGYLSIKSKVFFSYVKGKFWNKSGMLGIIDIVNGKKSRAEDNTSASSMYLKDITEYKNGIKKNKKFK